MRKVDKESSVTVGDNKIYKNKKLLVIVPVVFVLICIIFCCCFYFSRVNIYKNVVVKNTGFHEIEISWENNKKISNYVVLISPNKFTNKDVNNDLKDNEFNENYTTLEVKNNNKLKYDMVMSNTDYYISVVAYKNKNGSRKYNKASNVVKVHTNSLEIKKIENLSVEDFTDASIKLKWSLFETSLKNLDGTDIDISYTLFCFDKDTNNFKELVADIKEESYSVSDLKAFTKYSYKVVVSAIVDGKTVKSDDSNIIEVTTKPVSVSGVVSKSGGTSSISLNWDKYDKKNVSENATVSYSVYGSDSQDGEYKLLKENIEDTSYTESDLSQGKTRYYYVIASITVDNEKHVSNKSGIVSATTDKEVTSYNYEYSGNSSSGNNSGSVSSGGLTAAEKEAQARVIARQIANSITGNTDLEKVTKAAQAVEAYYARGIHKESGNDYYTAYGVFIKGESSCAGTTRALGMVLEEMGYSWQHVNENQWAHQWVIITMDGQVGYADGQVGLAGYGAHPLV